MVRYKNRYFLVEVNTPKGDEALKLGPSELHWAVTKMVQKLHGDFGVAAIRASFSSKYCNERSRIAVIRVRLGPHRIVASVLPLICSLEKKQVAIKTLYVGASIRQCYKFLQKYQQECFDKFCCSLKTEDERRAMKEALNFDSVLDVK